VTVPLQLFSEKKPLRISSEESICIPPQGCSSRTRIGESHSRLSTDKPFVRNSGYRESRSVRHPRCQAAIAPRLASTGARLQVRAPLNTAHALSEKEKSRARTAGQALKMRLRCGRMSCELFNYTLEARTFSTTWFSSSLRTGCAALDT